jgi:cyanate permease
MVDQELRAVILFDIMEQRAIAQRRAQRYELLFVLTLMCLVIALGALWWYTHQPPPINCPKLAELARAA